MSSDTTTPADLKAEIERTREDLGQTAAALAAKTDVKARTAAFLDTVRDRAATTVRRPVPVAVIAAVATAATVALVLIRRSRG